MHGEMIVTVGETPACVYVLLWPGAQVTVLPLQHLYALSTQRLWSLVQTALMALDCRSSWAEQLLWSNFVARLCVSCGSPQLYENCSLWFSSLPSSSAAKKKNELTTFILLLLQTWTGKGVLILLSRVLSLSVNKIKKDLFSNSICQICEVFVKPALWMCW